MTPAEFCRSNEYEVGDRLVGDEGFGDTIIEITAIGKEKVLAKTISHAGISTENEPEASWTFECREWKLVPPEPLPPLTAEDVQEAQLRIADAYVNAQLQCLNLLGHGELNYVKTAVDMGNGGKYLLMFCHVDGPKINVKEMFAPDLEKEVK